MANTVKANVFLESIQVASPGVGSMWEFSFWVDGNQVAMFNRVIPDGATAKFQKSLFAMDVPAKQPKSLNIQVAVREIDVISDYGNGGTTIAIDTTSEIEQRASFQASVTERGGTKAGAVATLTFGIVSEVEGAGKACEDCDNEFQTAQTIPNEFETTAGELITTLLPALASDFSIAFDTYLRARANFEVAIIARNTLADTVRTCAAQNPKQVKATCLLQIDRLEKIDQQLNTLALDTSPLLNTQADNMPRRYLAFLAEERIDLQIALYEAQLEAECEDNLAQIRDQLKRAREAKKDAAAAVGPIATVEQKAERDAKKLFMRLERTTTTRNSASLALQNCASSNGFGTCTPQAQALVQQDIQVITTLLDLTLAYRNVRMLLDRYNSQLSQQDDKLELHIENYIDALKQYTDCVSRLQ